MKHTVEEITPVKRKITVELPAAEVDAILDAVVNKYALSAKIPGFRPGKAPANMVEKRFAKEIYEEATSGVLNSQIPGIMQELDMEPEGMVDLASELLVRGQDYSYSFSFEIMPVFELPQYLGREMEVERVEATEEEIDNLIVKIRQQMGIPQDIEEKRQPRDGDIATVEFEIRDEEGALMEGISANNFKVMIGAGQLVPDFEALLRSLDMFESKEGDVFFPEDYHEPSVAGRTLHVKANLISLQTLKLPELDDLFLKQLGNFESIEALREKIRENFRKPRMEQAKLKAQSLLLEKMIEEVDFALPEMMVDRYAGSTVSERLMQMENAGEDINALTREQLLEWKEEARGDAEKYTRSQILLRTVAKKENLGITPDELRAGIAAIADKQGVEAIDLQRHYVENNMLPSLRNNLLAEKAMDFIFDKAVLRGEGAAAFAELAAEKAAEEKMAEAAAE